MFRGSFEFVVKMAFLDWEAAVLPLNYARGAKLFSITGPLCKFPCSIPVNFSAVCFDMFERPNQRFVFGKYQFTEPNGTLVSVRVRRRGHTSDRA
jgi:hypothetical protein